MKVRASRFVTSDDHMRLLDYIATHGSVVPFDKKVAIIANNNWRKFHGIPMKRGWRTLEW